MKYKWLLFFVMPISAFADELMLSNITNGCLSGFDNDTYFKATFTPNIHNCSQGYYLPLNTDNCVICTYGHACPGGTFSFNEVLDQGISYASYNCSNGYYLPANTDHCVMCPEYYDCDGGTFTFNEAVDQGNKFKTQITENIGNGCKANFLKTYNNASDMTATFTPNVHNCSAGYYLPANVDECTECLNDHYCPGGTYTFNETTPQGIISCPDNHPFAPAGMWQQSQCGRKLHVGDDILYMHQIPANPTVHRLFIEYPNGIYSVNTVVQDMNSNTFPKMSEGMSKGFHVKIDDIEYLVCDDSVPECRNTPQQAN